MRTKVTAITLTVLLVTMGFAPMTTAQTASGEAYAGTHVTFDVRERAVTDYAVDGERMLSSVKVQSKQRAESSGAVSVGADLSTVTNLEGSVLSLGASTETSATVKTDSSARMTAHDNGHGILVVDSGDGAQYVQANLSGGASAEAKGDRTVTVTSQSGAEGTFIVVGDGTVTVNENGDVVAKLGEDGRLVFRAYPDGKDQQDENQEQLIADGTAAAEVYVMQQGGKTVTDTVTYGQETTVTATESAKGTVTITAERASHEGTIVITSVSEKAIGSVEDVQVSVDGKAAAKATSYGELKGALGGQQSKYMVVSRSSASAEAGADVLVAVNHFSKREITMSSSQSGNDETTTQGGDATSDGAETTETSSPGFGAVAALVALAGAALFGRRLR